MRFYRLEREVVWSILQFMGQTLNLPLNYILVDSYILIAPYHNFSIQQKKIEKTDNSLLKVFQKGRLYKIIVTSLYYGFFNIHFTSIILFISHFSFYIGK